MITGTDRLFRLRVCNPERLAFASEPAAMDVEVVPVVPSGTLGASGPAWRNRLWRFSWLSLDSSSPRHIQRIRSGGRRKREKTILNTLHGTNSISNRRAWVLIRPFGTDSGRRGGAEAAASDRRQKPGIDKGLPASVPTNANAKERRPRKNNRWAQRFTLDGITRYGRKGRRTGKLLGNRKPRVGVPACGLLVFTSGRALKPRLMKLKNMSHQYFPALTVVWFLNANGAARPHVREDWVTSGGDCRRYGQVDVASRLGPVNTAGPGRLASIQSTEYGNAP